MVEKHKMEGMLCYKRFHYVLRGPTGIPAWARHHITSLQIYTEYLERNKKASCHKQFKFLKWRNNNSHCEEWIHLKEGIKTFDTVLSQFIPPSIIFLFIFNRAAAGMNAMLAADDAGVSSIIWKNHMLHSQTYWKHVSAVTEIRRRADE